MKSVESQAEEFRVILKVQIEGGMAEGHQTSPGILRSAASAADRR